MLRDNPQDKNLQDLFARVRKRLEDTYEKEKQLKLEPSAERY